MSRMKAAEFQKKTTEERDWEIFDVLLKGQDTMHRLRDDVDAVFITVDDHINDQSVHHSNPGAGPQWRDRLTPRNVGVGAGGGTALLTLIYLLLEVIKNG